MPERPFRNRPRESRPVCGLGEQITPRKGGFYRCNQCKEDFTVRTGTIFERSHVPRHKWIYAMYLVVRARKGLSSVQLAKEIGVTQKTAWFILGRLREAYGDNFEKLGGIVEIDESWIGGSEENKHADKRQPGRQGGAGNAAVLGMRERGGRTKMQAVARANQATVEFAILDNIEAGATIYTDEYRIYNGLRDFHYQHANHQPLSRRIRPRGRFDQQHRSGLGCPEARYLWHLPPSQREASRPTLTSLLRKGKSLSQPRLTLRTRRRSPNLSKTR